MGVCVWAPTAALPLPLALPLILKHSLSSEKSAFAVTFSVSARSWGCGRALRSGRGARTKKTSTSGPGTAGPGTAREQRARSGAHAGESSYHGTNRDIRARAAAARGGGEWLSLRTAPSSHSARCTRPRHYRNLRNQEKQLSELEESEREKGRSRQDKACVVSWCRASLGNGYWSNRAKAPTDCAKRASVAASLSPCNATARASWPQPRNQCMTTCPKPSPKRVIA